MAASLGAAGAHRFASRGIAPISTRQGLEALGRIMRQSQPQVVVLPIDWVRFAQQFPAGRGPAWLKALVEEGLQAKLPEVSALTEKTVPEATSEVSNGQLRDRVHQQVRDLAARILGLDAAQTLDSQRPLSEIGLDSMMAVELSNALSKSTECRLPSQLIFDRPTIDALTDYLVGQLVGQNTKQAGPN
jgi:polyketide synthase 12/myxalamid-type polyketide synthase MxaB